MGRARGKLTPAGRLLLVQRVTVLHWPVSQAAASMGVSRETTYEWLACWRLEGAAGLVHADRGASVCANNRVVRQDVIEQKVLDHVFGGLFTPHRIAYLERAVDAALKRILAQSTDSGAQREGALRDARRELDNMALAIRQGIITPTTRQMLEEAEHLVTTLERGLKEPRRRLAPVVSVRSVVEGYLRDLRVVLGANVDEARRMLAMAVDKIVLRREGERLIARVIGNLAGMFALEPNLCGSVGAGRGILRLPPWPCVTRTIA